jgi:hypothetical protein
MDGNLSGLGLLDELSELPVGPLDDETLERPSAPA